MSKTIKYNKEELAELAKGDFRGSKNAVLYAREDGTFLNERQYEESKKKGEHKDFVHVFKNPSMKPAPVAGSTEKDAQIADLKKEIAAKDELLEEAAARLDSNQETILGLRQEIADLKKAAATPSAPMAVAKTTKKTTTSKP